MLVWGVSTSLGVPGHGVCSLEPFLRVPLPHLHLTPPDSRSDFRFLENARQGWGGEAALEIHCHPHRV